MNYSTNEFYAWLHKSGCIVRRDLQELCIHNFMRSRIWEIINKFYFVQYNNLLYRQYFPDTFCRNVTTSKNSRCGFKKSCRSWKKNIWKHISGFPEPSERKIKLDTRDIVNSKIFPRTHIFYSQMRIKL